MDKVTNKNLTAGKLLSSAWSSRHGFMLLFWILMIPYLIISKIISGSVPIIGYLVALLVVAPIGQAGLLVITRFHLKKQAWDRNTLIEIFNSNKIFEILKANLILSAILYIPLILVYFSMVLFMSSESINQLLITSTLISVAYYLMVTTSVMLVDQHIIFQDYSAMAALKAAIHILLNF